MMRCALLVLLLVPTFAFAQTPPVKNPTGLAFTSPDHSNPAVSAYEIDFMRQDNTVLQTVTVPKAQTTLNAAQEVVVTVNVQPVAFGFYTFVARTIAGTAKSLNSPNSDPWERAPGAPSKPRVARFFNWLARQPVNAARQFRIR